MFWNTIVVLVVSIALGNAQVRSKRPFPVFRQDMVSNLTLPNNATAIRENIVDNFSCDGRIYGYYADIDNDCQIFHVCLPQDKRSMRWSFICPAETVFNQETFVCTRTGDSIPCVESEQYYGLNEEFGKEEKDKEDQGEEGEEAKPEESTQNSYNPNPTDYDNELPITPSYNTRIYRTRVRSDRRGKGLKNDNNDNSTTETVVMN